MCDDGDTGVGGGAASGEHPCWSRRQCVSQSFGPIGGVLAAGGTQPLDGTHPAAGGEIAALGEDDQRVVGVHVGGQFADGLDGLGASAWGRVDEAAGQAVQHHVDERVQLQGCFQDDAGLAPPDAQQAVDDKERVTWSGVAGEYERWAIGADVGGARLVPLGDYGQPEHALGNPNQAGQHRPEQAVVALLEPGALQEQPESGHRNLSQGLE